MYHYVIRKDLSGPGAVEYQMILSVADRLTEDLMTGRRNRRFPPALVARVERKLKMIEAAAQLSDLASPPGNGLHALKDDLAGFHAIKINDQWRIVFRWTEAGAEDVRVVDYH